MQMRRLGKSGPLVSEVGLGCWQFGGDFGEMSEETAREIMEASARGGVDFFDTADVYGAGRSEEWIGRFLRESRRTIFVATKYGRAGDAYPDKYSEAGLRRSIDRARGRLGKDALDLLQLHCIPGKVLREGRVFDWLRRAQQDGLIKHFGASVETVEEGLLCLEQEGLLSLQVIFNIFRQKPAEELLPQAARRGVGIIVRLPLASGLLAGKFTLETKFAGTDHRHYNRDGRCFNVGETFAGLPYEKGVELAEELRNFVPDGWTMTQLAQRWILDHDAVSAIIPGASSPAQAAENASMAGLPPLSRDLHESLGAFYRNGVRVHIRGPY
jgi:aryl-alcohol dehydrogenase-like predicted oxidoreductase